MKLTAVACIASPTAGWANPTMPASGLGNRPRAISGLRPRPTQPLCVRVTTVQPVPQLVSDVVMLASVRMTGEHLNHFLARCTRCAFTCSASYLMEEANVRPGDDERRVTSPGRHHEGLELSRLRSGQSDGPTGRRVRDRGRWQVVRHRTVARDIHDDAITRSPRAAAARVR